MPITFIALGIEPNGFDSSVASFAENISFNHAGLDLVDDGGRRSQIRNGFAHFSGEPAERTPGQVSINERRRFVILDGQPGPNQWEVLYIANDFSRRDTESVRAIIDAVSPSGDGGNSTPAPDLSMLDSDDDGLNDAFELSHGLDPEDASDRDGDADGDGLSNIQEFLAGTSPSDPESRLTITDVRASDAEIGLRWESVPGVTYQVEAAENLDAEVWDIAMNVVAEGERAEAVLDRDSRQFFRVRVVDPD